MPGVIVYSRLSAGAHAGQKAPLDVRSIAVQLGASAIDLSPYNPASTWTRLLSTLNAGWRVLRTLRIARRADVLILQHPLGKLNDVILGAATRRVPSIAFIHDLEFLRWSRHSLKEAQRLAHSRVLIAHTAAMAAYLGDAIPTATIFDLERFDYILDGASRLPVASPLPRRLIIAGSLDPRKAPYIYEIEDLALPLDLYGPTCDVSRLRRGVIHQGLLSSSRPALETRDGFGVVWDGVSTLRLAGPTGEYLRYNSPHKFSLYMALGIPVIVSSESALAPLVARRGLGLLVEDLSSAAARAAEVTAGQWSELLHNVEEYRKDLIRGGRTEEVLKQALAGLRSTDSARPAVDRLRS